MLAEIVKHFHPQLVDLHNYVPTCNTDQQLSNWSVLNRQAPGRLLRPAPPCKLPSLPLLETPASLSPPTWSLRALPPQWVWVGRLFPAPPGLWDAFSGCFLALGFPHTLLSVSVPVPWDLTINLGVPHQEDNTGHPAAHSLCVQPTPTTPLTRSLNNNSGARLCSRCSGQQPLPLWD